MQRGRLVFFLLLAASAFGAASPGFVYNQRSQLRTLEVGSGNRLLVLLQGYGASPEQWLPFTQVIHRPRATRFVFPEAPEPTVPPDGPINGRGWWRIDLASYLRRGETIPDLSQSNPAGLTTSANKVRTLLDEMQARLGADGTPPILGGFSQGAMISADVAFASDQPLKALIILSGSFVDEARWTRGMARRRGLPVFIAHGESDRVLRYDLAVRLRDAMKGAGLQVRWVPFASGHEIPAEVVAELNAFLSTLSD